MYSSRSCPSPTWFRPSSREPSRRNHVGEGHDLRSEEHTSELQSRSDLVCRLLLEKKKHDAGIVPHFDPKQCPLRVGGSVDRRLRLTYQQLLRPPFASVAPPLHRVIDLSTCGTARC